MHVRGIWIMKRGKDSSYEVIYSRRFGIVECLVKRHQKEKYVSVPTNQQMCDWIPSVLWSSATNTTSAKSREDRDSCDKPNIAPIYEMSPVDGDNKQSVLRFVIISEKNHVLCCLPFSKCDNCLDDPGPVFALEILFSVSEILDASCTRPADSTVAESLSKFDELDNFLGAAMPLGRPIDINPMVIREKLLNVEVTEKLQSKQPAWKPILHKGKSKLLLTITESVRSVQYDRPEMPDAVDMFGTVSCTALLEGPSPEVTLTLTHEDTNKRLDIDTLICHPCLSSIDKQTVENYYKIRFMPPNAKFDLCSYVIPNIDEMPVRGAFKMKGENTLDLLLQLKLSSHIKNTFEFFEAIIPFFNRGRITHADLEPSWGMTSVVQSRRWIVWNLGHKFPSKCEASLKGSVVIEPVDVAGDTNPLVEFCTGLNCYAEIVFQTKSSVYSSCTVEPKNVHISPDVKYKFSIDRMFVSSDCKIWNTYGDVPSYM